MIKVIFLDIDNTLLSFSGYVKETMRKGFAEYGLKPYNDSMYGVFERINNYLWSRIEQGTLTFAELMKVRWNMIFDALGIRFDGELFEAYFGESLFSSAVPEDGAAEMLAYLSKEYTLCAASNGPYEQQLNRLRVGGMFDYFTHFFISEKIGAPKPGREFFDACFRTLRESGYPALMPGETMIIGDSISSDIAGGKAYGIRTCLYHPADRPAIDTEDADFVISGLHEIKLIL